MISFLKKLEGKINVTGIIQVGSNVGQELVHLKNITNNIICFEPVPSVFEVLKKNNPNIECYNFALGDRNEIKKMYVASNNSESSSFLKPLNHKVYYSVTFDDELELKIKRFDSLDISIEHYNVLISDTQGYELKVLEGFGELLNKFEIIIVEYINSKLYENDSNLEDISKFLKKYNFIEFDKTEDGPGWGNICFIKK